MLFVLFCFWVCLFFVVVFKQTIHWKEVYMCTVARLKVNSVDPDKTAHEPSRLDLCSLQKPVIIACGSERVKYDCNIMNF